MIAYAPDATEGADVDEALHMRSRAAQHRSTLHATSGSIAMPQTAAAALVQCDTSML